MPRRICQFGGGLVVAFAFASGAQAEPATPAVATDHERAVVRPAAVGAKPMGAKPMGAQPETQALPAYRSPLSEYRPYRVDEPLRPWKDANAEVGRLGGHRGHLDPPAGGGAR